MFEFMLMRDDWNIFCYGNNYCNCVFSSVLAISDKVLWVGSLCPCHGLSLVLERDN